jgi:Mg2+ and Co2+ transporter CorA
MNVQIPMAHFPYAFTYITVLAAASASIVLFLWWNKRW